MARSAILGLACAILATSAAAQRVESCGGGPISDDDIEFARAYGPSFANGAVAISEFFVDNNLPNGVLLIVRHPRPSDLAGGGMYDACSLIYSDRDEISYFNRVFDDVATASYDPARGLTITMPIRHYVGNGDFQDDVLKLTVNQATGWITFE